MSSQGAGSGNGSGLTFRWQSTAVTQAACGRMRQHRRTGGIACGARGCSLSNLSHCTVQEEPPAAPGPSLVYLVLSLPKPLRWEGHGRRSVSECAVDAKRRGRGSLLALTNAGKGSRWRGRTCGRGARGPGCVRRSARRWPGRRGPCGRRRCGCAAAAQVGTRRRGGASSTLQAEHEPKRVAPYHNPAPDCVNPPARGWAPGRGRARRRRAGGRRGCSPPRSPPSCGPGAAG